MGATLDSGWKLFRRLQRELRLRLSAQRMRRDIVIEGVDSTGLWPIPETELAGDVTLDADWPDDGLRLGWFITAPDAPHNATRLAEGRLTLVRQAPGRLSFTLPLGAIARHLEGGAGTLWLDLVQGSEFWFFEFQGSPRRLRLAATPLRGHGRQAAMAWLQAARPSALAELATRTGTLNLAAPLDAARRHAALKPPPGDELAPWPGPPRHAPDAGGRSLRDLASGPPAGLLETELGTPSMRLSRALARRGGWPRIQPEHRPYFQHVRLHQHDSGAPLTAAMLDALALTPLAELARILSSPEAVREWWLFDIVLPHGLPVEALPAQHLQHWRSTDADAAAPPLSHFVHHARERHAPELEKPRLDDAPGRLALLFRHLLREFRDPRAFALTGQEALDPLRQRLCADGREATLFQVLVALALCHAGAAHRSFADALDDAARIVNRELPQLAALLTGPPCADQPLMLVGHNNSSGLGENFRMFVASFARSGTATRIFDAEDGDTLVHDAQGMLVPLSQQPARGIQQGVGRRLSRPTSLFMVNPDRMSMLAARQDFAGLTGRRRIGFFLTEMRFLPPAMAAACDRMDEIWTPSDFVRDAYAAHTRTPVFNLGKALNWPLDVPDPYGAILPAREETFVFMTSFDPGSWLRRKNPTAVVAAFLAAFPTRREKVALVIRLPDSARGHPGDPFDEWRLIEQVAAREPRIIIQEGFAPFVEYLGHVAHADCVVSAHRSEGFGYLCAQAHHFTTPLICTGYSGNMDFCTPENAWLIDYDMRPVTEGEFLPGTRGDWADPRVPHLAELMRRLPNEPERAQRMAEAGCALVRERYAPRRFDAAVLERLSA